MTTFDDFASFGKFGRALDEHYPSASVYWDRDMAEQIDLRGRTVAVRSYRIRFGKSLIRDMDGPPGVFLSVIALPAKLNAAVPARNEAWFLVDPIPHWMLVRIHGQATDAYVEFRKDYISRVGFGA